MKSVYALVDCNNCFASAETLFRPDLRNTPVIVLSNNDGCIVARDALAKALGIKMGAPVHHIQQEIRQHGIKVFSSNYTLYGDISRRVMETLEELAPRVDIYSIDEAFLDVTGIDRVVSFEAYGQQVKNTVHKNTGMSVCVGIAPTRTLAKLANHGAKKYPATNGVVDLTDPARQRRLMDLVSVDKVWGVGGKLSAKLQAMGITTALGLADADPAIIRQRFSVVLERTARELNGVACLPWEDVPQPKKQIMCSRSFGASVRSLSDLEEAVTHFASSAAVKLRKGRQCAGSLMVFVRTNPFRKDSPQYSNGATVRMVVPTQDTRVIVLQAVSAVRELYREGFDYAKAGVMLSDTVSDTQFQGDLFVSHTASEGDRSTKLMSVVDDINRMSRAKIGMAREMGEGSYAMRREHLSPAYTTDWAQIPKVM